MAHRARLEKLPLKGKALQKKKPKNPIGIHGNPKDYILWKSDYAVLKLMRGPLEVDYVTLTDDYKVLKGTYGCPKPPETPSPIGKWKNLIKDKYKYVHYKNNRLISDLEDLPLADISKFPSKTFGPKRSHATGNFVVGNTSWGRKFIKFKHQLYIEICKLFEDVTIGKIPNIAVSTEKEIRLCLKSLRGFNQKNPPWFNKLGWIFRTIIKPKVL